MELSKRQKRGDTQSKQKYALAAGNLCQLIPRKLFRYDHYRQTHIRVIQEMKR